MGKNGLLDIGMVSIVFTPLALTAMLLLCIWWNRIKDSRAVMPAMDRPGIQLSIRIIGYALIVMHFIAGGPNGD